VGKVGQGKLLVGISMEAGAPMVCGEPAFAVREVRGRGCGGGQGWRPGGVGWFPSTVYVHMSVEVHGVDCLGTVGVGEWGAGSIKVTRAVQRVDHVTVVEAWGA